MKSIRKHGFLVCVGFLVAVKVAISNFGSGNLLERNSWSLTVDRFGLCYFQASGTCASYV